MIHRSRKEVNHMVSGKEHNKEERLKTMESDLEIEKKNNPFPSPVVFDPTVTYKSRVPYP